jgi:prepilin-type N-terminal cleavage/methylation domain-containing protein
MRKRKNLKGFTLIELLVVVAIIGVLAAVGVTAFSGFQENAKKSSMKSIHANIVKIISSEAKKCSMGNQYFFEGLNSGGGVIRQTCGTSPQQNYGRARAGIINMAWDNMNPWDSKNRAVWNGASWVNGRTYVTTYATQGKYYIRVRSCWSGQNACPTADRKETLVQIE